MVLLDRLLGLGSPKIPVHQFAAAVAEGKRDPFVESAAARKARIVSMFSLDAGESSALDVIIGRITADTITREQLHDALMLGEYGLYTKSEVETSLGIGS